MPNRLSFRNGGRVKNDGWVISHAAEPGKIQGGRAVTNDVGEHKRAEEARARLAAIVESSQDAILSRAFDGTILSWNAAAERLFGYSAAEAIGRPIAELIHLPEARARIAQNVERVRRGEVVAPYETRRKTKDGRVIDVLSSVSPIRNEAGEVTGASNILHDISALKRAEAAMKDSEERFRATFEQAGVGMALRDIDPRKPRWLRVNQKLCDILGYTREELLQLSSVDVTPPEDRNAAIDYNEKLLRGEIVSYSREKRYVRKDGRIIWANITLSAVNGPDDRPTHIISVIEDTTERKQAEERLRKVDRARRVMAECNRVMVHADDETRLLQDICTTAVESGGYRMAWVGFAEHDEHQSVRVIAQAGFDEGYLVAARISWGDNERGRGPSGRAIRLGHICVVRNVVTDPDFAPWRENALARGYRSHIALPLASQGAAFGVLSLYTTEVNAFDTDEVALLENLAADLAYGIVILRARVEHTRAETERAQLASIVENSNDAIISRTLDDGTITSWNAAAERLLGYSAAEAIGRPIEELIYPQEMPRIAQNIERVRRGEAVAPYETRRKTKDGRAIDVMASISPIRNSAGEIISASVIFHDISALKQAEAARVLFATIVEHANDAIVSRALDGTILSWNAAAERLYGYTAAEAIGNELAQMVPPELRHEITQFRELLRQDKPVPNHEIVRITKDGRRIDVLYSASPLMDGSGNVIGMAAITRDIGALKQAERELRRKTELAQLLEALARAANEATTPEAAMKTCLERICGYGNWMLGRVATFAPGQPKGVPQTSLWHCPQPARFDEFMRISNTFNHTPPSGKFTNIALREKKPVWVSDFSAAQGFGRLASAAKFGIRSGFVFPVVLGDKAQAFLEFFAGEVREPDTVFLEAIGSVAGQLARVIERERARSALHESEHQMRLVTEHTPAMVAYFDAELICRFANSAFCGFHHLDPRDVTGMSLRDITGEDTYRVIGPTIARVKEGKPVTMRRQEQAESGEIRHIEIHRVPDMSPEGAFRGYYAMLLDVTAQVQAEETRAQLATIVESSNDAIVSRALDGTILTWNTGAEQLFGYTAAEMTGGNLHRLIPPDQAAQTQRNRALVHQGHELSQYEAVRVTRDGRRIDVSISASPIRDAAGNIARVALIFRDISERKQAEEQILKLNAELEQRVTERTRQLEAANKELEAFSYSVSHDLRAPLRGIDGFSQMLLQKYAGHLDATGSDYLQRIRRASLRMGELIDDLLQLSRVGRSQIRAEAVDLSRLARSILAELREREPGRKVVTEVQDGIEVSADPRLLKIALENLLGNAWKFTGKNGEAKIRFGAKRQDRELIVFVKDNGAGFNTKYAHKLFGAFQRLHAAAEFEGTGIGLATVQRIISLHGGRIWADAAMGKGATFYFAVPCSAWNEMTTTQQGEAA